jgi:hypothetical protein
MCAKERRKFLRNIKKRGVIMTAPTKTPAKRAKRAKRGKRGRVRERNANHRQ